MTQAPILILGDSPSLHGGLSRVGGDLAWLLSSMPEFTVGYLGRGGIGSIKFPWAMYNYPESQQWGEDYLVGAWNDLAGKENGILLSIWDATRLLWLARPDGMSEPLRGLLTSGRMRKWGYFMQDSDGVAAGLLPWENFEVMRNYERTLLASKWAYDIAERTADLAKRTKLDWLPHGLNLDTFKPQDPAVGRSFWNVHPDEVAVGIVATNQERKHWPVMMEAFALLSMRMPAKLWIHTDRTMGYWNLLALATEYGINDKIIHEGRPLSDKEMAMRYSACDATMVISGGEGFCYPVAESLACGTPVVTGSYGAQFELGSYGVQPAYTRIETRHNCRRAHYDPKAVAGVLEQVLGEHHEPEDERAKVEHLAWSKIGPLWKRWFREGLK